VCVCVCVCMCVCVCVCVFVCVLSFNEKRPWYEEIKKTFGVKQQMGRDEMIIKIQ